MPRLTIPVDRPKLEAALREAEKNGPLANLGLLWRTAAEIYNETAERPISFSVVMLRVQEWKIVVTTQPGRKTRSAVEAEEAEEIKTIEEPQPQPQQQTETEDEEPLIPAPPQVSPPAVVKPVELPVEPPKPPQVIKQAKTNSGSWVFLCFRSLGRTCEYSTWTADDERGPRADDHVFDNYTAANSDFEERAATVVSQA